VAYHHHPGETAETKFSSLAAVHAADAIVSATETFPLNSTTGGLLMSRGQEITPTVIFKLRNFHSRGAIAGEITVAMPKTTLSFVKGASQGEKT